MKKYKLREHVVLEWYNEWEQFDSSVKWNWITGTLIHIYFEKEHHGYNFQFTLFGLGFFFRYNTDKSLKLFKKWEKESGDIDWSELLSSQENFDKHVEKKSSKLKKVL